MRSASSARIQMRVGRQKFFYAAGAEEFPFPVARLGESIRIKEENIARSQAARSIPRRWHRRKCRSGNPVRLICSTCPSFQSSGCVCPALASAKFVAPFLPRGEANRHVAAFHAAVAHQLIQLAEKFRGLQLVRRKAAQNSGGHRAVERRGASLPADVSQSDAQLLRAVGKKIVQIAADFPRGKNSRGDVEAEIDVGHGAQQARSAGAARR